jgi:hypothetical protein
MTSQLSLLIPLTVFLLDIALCVVILIAARMFAAALFDTRRAVGQQHFSANVMVNNGTISEDSSPLLRGMGGPGLLMVDEHSAAALDKFGHFTRVVGGGYHLLQRYECVRGAVDLRRHLSKGTSKAYTRDGIPVSYDVEMEFRVLPAAESPKAEPPQAKAAKARANPSREPLRPYTFSPDAVWQAVYSLPVMDDGKTQEWGASLLRSGLAQIDGFIAGHYFDEFSLDASTMAAPTRVEMSVRRLIQRQAEATAASALRSNGAELLALRLSSFRFDETEAAGILDQRFDDWKTYWANEALKVRRDGEKEAFKAHESARAEAHRTMLVLMADSLKAMASRSADPQQVLWLRIVESLEHMALDSSSYRFVPQEIFSMIQNLKAISGGSDPSAAGGAAKLPAAPDTPLLPAASSPDDNDTS